MWRNSAASSAFFGERGTGIAPRLPHPGEVSPGAPSLLSSASSQLRFAVCGRLILIFSGVTLFFAGAHAAPAPRARQSGILLLVCPRFMAGGSLDSCGAILRPLPPFMAKEALVLRHGCRIRGNFPRSPLGAGWHLCCLALRFAGAQSGFAVRTRFEWMRYGVG